MDEPPQINPLDYTDIVNEVFSWIGYNAIKEVSTVSKRFESVVSSNVLISKMMDEELTAKTSEGNLGISIKLCRPEYVKRLMTMHLHLVPTTPMLSYILERCTVSHPQSSCYMRIYRELNLGQLVYVKGLFIDLQADNLREVFESLGGAIPDLSKTTCESDLENILGNLDIFFEPQLPDWSGPVQYAEYGIGRRARDNETQIVFDKYAPLSSVRNPNKISTNVTATYLLGVFSNVKTIGMLSKLLSNSIFRKYVPKDGLHLMPTRRRLDTLKVLANQSYYDLSINNNDLYSGADKLGKLILIKNPSISKYLASKQKKIIPISNDREEFRAFVHYVIDPTLQNESLLTKALSGRSIIVTWGPNDSKKMFLSPATFRFISRMGWDSGSRERYGLAEYMSDLQASHLFNLKMYEYI